MKTLVIFYNEKFHAICNYVKHTRFSSQDFTKKILNQKHYVLIQALCLFTNLIFSNIHFNLFFDIQTPEELIKNLPPWLFNNPVMSITPLKSVDIINFKLKGFTAKVLILNPDPY